MEGYDHAHEQPSYALINEQVSESLCLLFPSAISAQKSVSNLNQSNVSPRLLVALSGGLDSVVLTHALLQVKLAFQFELFAIHIHHGISPNADAWEKFCVKLCELWNIPLQCVRIHLPSSSKKGVEAEAREQRYSAIQAHLSEINADWIVLAHHQQDQAETLLLQAIRGAGVKGLASMATVDSKRRRFRPLLHVPRSHIEDYASHHRLDWINDESNADIHYDRNYLRHAVFPILKARFPSVENTFSRVARHMAESIDLLDVLAESDFSHFSVLSGNLNQFPMAIFTEMDRARAKNVFRWWLQKSDIPMLSEKRISALWKELQSWRYDDHFSFRLNHDYELKRYEDGLFLVKLKQPLPFDMLWQPASSPSLLLPDGSQVFIERVVGKGLALVHVANHYLRVRNRQGGEVFSWQQRRPQRSLKVIFQMAKMPPWNRDCIPLVYLGDTLVCIPDVAIDERYTAKADEVGLMLSWNGH